MIWMGVMTIIDLAKEVFEDNLVKIISDLIT